MTPTLDLVPEYRLRALVAELDRISEWETARDFARSLYGDRVARLVVEGVCDYDGDEHVAIYVAAKSHAFDREGRVLLYDLHAGWFFEMTHATPLRAELLRLPPVDSHSRLHEIFFSELRDYHEAELPRTDYVEFDFTNPPKRTYRRIFGERNV